MSRRSLTLVAIVVAGLPLAVFIGDSSTVGSGTSLSGPGFPAIVGSLRDWEIANLGVAGTGHATNRDETWCPAGGCLDYAGVIPQAVELEPDIVVVSGGRNDLARNTVADIEPIVSDFHTQLRQAPPDVSIIVTSPIWDDHRRLGRCSSPATSSSVMRRASGPSTSNSVTPLRATPTSAPPMASTRTRRPCTT